MNGFSLLLALATVGITAQVELGPTNQPTYTIRIESLVLNELRQGREIETNVALKDRQVRHFRILVTPDPAARGGSFQPRTITDNTGRSESLVEYEAVELQNNEIEMWVQIAPERIETLAAGKAIDGEVPAKVPEINRYRIFVGVNQLPRQQATAPQPADASPPYLLPSNQFGLTPAGAEARSSTDALSRNAAPLTNQFQGGTAATKTRTNAVASPPTIRSSDTRGTFRNGPDSSTIASPPIDYFGQSSTSFDSRPVTPNSVRDSRAGTSSGTRFDDQYAQQPYSGRNSGFDFGNANSVQSSPAAGQYLNPAVPAQSQPQATIAARPENSGVTASNPAINGWTQTTANAQPVAQAAQTAAAPPAAAPVAVVGKTAEEPAKSSTPLILTTIALFTSLGVNTYLGWLAWSFFWRYRDAVNDSARARSYNAPGRQAA